MSGPSTSRTAQDLDQALLFLSAFAASVLVVGFNLAFKPDLLQFSIVAPPLVVVGVMPLYVGYMRGTVEQNSVRERARGWVYLIFGLGWYSTTVMAAPVVLGSDLLSKYLLSVLALIALLALLGFCKRFVLWFYKTLGFSTIPLTDKIGIFSVVSGLFVSAFFYQAVLAFKMGTTLNNQPFAYDPVTAQLVSFAEGVWLLFPLIVLEVKSHHCLDEAAVLYDRRWRPKIVIPPHASKRVSDYLDAILVILMPLVLMFSVRGSTRFLVGVGLSAVLLLAGIILSTYTGWIGVPLLIGADLCLSFAVYFHLRSIWGKVRSAVPM